MEASVAVLPGTAFGVHGEGCLRLSYANSMENIKRAIQQMRPIFENLAVWQEHSVRGIKGLG